MPYINQPLQVTEGIQSTEDFTPQSTPHYVEGDKVRFVDGFPEKIGGWDSLSFPPPRVINGVSRLTYSFIFDNNINYLIGTHTNLYHILSSRLTNITPLKTTSVSLNNAFSTIYGSLSTDPFTSTSGSPTLVVTDTGHDLVNGDIINISGATAFDGIPAGELNASHVVGDVTTNTYEITVTTSATSSSSGGGASVIRSTRLISVSLTDHGYLSGDNVRIANTTSAVGGITAAQIDGTYSIRKVTTNSFTVDVLVAFATSSATGGSTADLFEEIDNGTQDPTSGTGYGLGRYGVGLYGVPKTSLNPTLPTIWSADRFGDLVVTTPGTQTGLYAWDASPANLPTLVANAPTAINYVFVSNEITVTLGANGVGNRIQWSDQGNLTTWSATAENRAGSDDIEGAGDFISHASLRGFNLLFTREQVYSFRYIDRPFIWETRQIDPTRGLIATNARVVVNGVCYWMGRDNFYLYKGGNVEIIPSNTIRQSTVKELVFKNINVGQRSKVFAWYNERFNEVWWHYPSGTSLECDRVVTFNIRTFAWGTHQLDRTSAEYPAILGSFPYLVNQTGTVYRHENGNNDETNPLRFSLKTPFFNAGTQPVALGGVHPDSIRNGNISVTLNTKFYPKGTISSTTYTLGDTVDKLAYRRRGRYWQYDISGEELDQEWRSGLWIQEFTPSGRK